MVWNAFANRFKQPRRGKERRRRDRIAVRDRGAFFLSLGGEWLENRALLANASLVGNDLQIDFIATGSTSEAVTIASDGTTYTLAGDITGTTSFSVASVNRITLSASGNSTAQQMTFQGGTAYSLSSGLTSTGVDTVTITQAISTGTGNISLTAPRNISVSASLTTTSGTITLDADSGSQASGSFIGVNVAGAISVSTGSGSIVIEGRGGNATGAQQIGVKIESGATVAAGGSGSLSITGVGGGATGQGSNHGVAIDGGGTARNTVVKTANGNLSITGTGGSGGAADEYNLGVVLQFGGVATSSGTGTVTVSGTGGGAAGSNNNWGVRLDGNTGGATTDSTFISSSGGAITVNATAGVGSTSYPLSLIEKGSIGTTATFAGLSSLNHNITIKTVQGSASAAFDATADSLISAGTGNVTLQSDTLSVNGTDPIVTSTGTLTLQPVSTSFASGFSLATFAGNFSVNPSASGLNSLTGLSIGKAGNTATIGF